MTIKELKDELDKALLKGWPKDTEFVVLMNEPGTFPNAISTRRIGRTYKTENSEYFGVFIGKPLTNYRP